MESAWKETAQERDNLKAEVELLTSERERAAAQDKIPGGEDARTHFLGKLLGRNRPRRTGSINSRTANGTHMIRDDSDLGTAERVEIENMPNGGTTTSKQHRSYDWDKARRIASKSEVTNGG